MSQFKKQLLILLAIIPILTLPLSAQIIGKLTQSTDKKTYNFSIIPDKTITRPNNITNTAQITFKASAGSFDVAKVKSITGIWQYNSIIRSPIESPNFDYIVFTLATPLANPNFQANVELPLFSFENRQGCIGSIELIENFTDEFWPPNSIDANIGIQLTILEYGIDNAYEKNDPTHSKIVCPIALNYKIKTENAKCADQNGLLTIFFNDGDLPFNYEVVLYNGQRINGTIENRGDSAQVELLAGAHQFLGFDQKDSLNQAINILSPSPLNIHIVKQEKITCNDTDGAAIEIRGTGGWAEESFKFDWSNGLQGKQLTQLAATTYSVTLTDENNCTTSRDFLIEQDLPINIDSVEMLLPTCHNSADGMIEMIEIKNGTPPFLYSLNERPAQSTPFFENLKGGEYRINVTDSKNCVTQKRIDLQAPPKLEIHAIDLDTVLIAGQSTNLLANVSPTDEIHYNWTPSTYLSCTDCPSPTAKPIKDIAYTLEIFNDFGCAIATTKSIKVLQKRPVFVPNAFSPNADGNNDEFKIFLGPTIKFAKELQIFNRWGQLMHHAKNQDNSTSLVWDGTFQGKQVDSGVYIYVAEVILDNGNSEIYKGDFFLLK